MRMLTLSMLLTSACEAPVPSLEPELVAIDAAAMPRPTWFRTEGVVELARLETTDEWPSTPVSDIDLACEHIDDAYRLVLSSHDDQSALRSCDGLARCRWGAEQMDRIPPAQRDRLARSLVSCTGAPGRRIFDRAGLSDITWRRRASANEAPLPQISVGPLLRSIEQDARATVVVRLASVPDPSEPLTPLLAAYDAELTGSERQMELGLAFGRFGTKEAWERHVETCQVSTSLWCARPEDDRLLPGYTLQTAVRQTPDGLRAQARRFWHEFSNHREELLSALDQCSRQPLQPDVPYDPNQRDIQVEQCAVVLSELKPSALQPNKVLAGLAGHRELVAAQRRYDTVQGQLSDLADRGLVPADATSPTVQTVARVMVRNDTAVHMPHDVGIGDRPSHESSLRRLATLAELDGVHFVQPPDQPPNPQQTFITRVYIRHNDNRWSATLADSTYVTLSSDSVAIINTLLANRGDAHRLLLTQEDIAIRAAPDILAALVRDGLVVPSSRTSKDWALERRWRTWHYTP